MVTNRLRDVTMVMVRVSRFLRGVNLGGNSASSFTEEVAVERRRWQEKFMLKDSIPRQPLNIL